MNNGKEKNKICEKTMLLNMLKTNWKRRLEKYPLKSLSSSRPPFPFQRSHSTKPFSSPSRRSQISNSGFEANYKVQQSQERTKTKDKVTQYNLLLNDTVYSRKFTFGPTGAGNWIWTKNTFVHLSCNINKP